MEPSNRFIRCHSEGEAYKTYLELKPKFDPEFTRLTFELLVYSYMIYERQYNGNIVSIESIKEFWTRYAKNLEVFEKYPYRMGGNWFCSTHPLSEYAVFEAKRRLGIE